MTYDVEFSNRAETDLCGLISSSRTASAAQNLRNGSVSPNVAASGLDWPIPRPVPAAGGQLPRQNELDHANRRIIILRVQHRSEAYR